MEISVNNKNGRTIIDVMEENVSCGFYTDEKYDDNGFQHIPSSIINTLGFPNPTLDKQMIIDMLLKEGYIVDKV